MDSKVPSMNCFSNHTHRQKQEDELGFGDSGGEDISKYHLLTVKKTRQQTQNGVAHTKPHVSKPRLNYSFVPSRNRILNQSIKNCLNQH